MKPSFLSKAVNWASSGFIKFGWYNSSAISQESPIVLGGCSRSGTTLLQSILNAHSKVYIALETALFCSGYNRNLGHLAYHTGMDIKRLRAHYRRSAYFGEFAERVLKDLMRMENKTYWGDKSPECVRHLVAMWRAFPNARFIHIFRDGRDVVASLRTHPRFAWENGKRVPTNRINPWEQCVKEWVSDVRSGLRSRSDSRYYEIKYEELVDNPEPVLRRLLNFLGLSWEPSILELYKSDHLSTHPTLAKDINRDAIGRWQKDLPADALALFEPEGNLLLAELGYLKPPVLVQRTKLVSAVEK